MTAPTKHPELDVLYLAGPMSGLPGFNTHTFNCAAAALSAAGYVVYNPADPNLSGLTCDPTALTGHETNEQIGFRTREAFLRYSTLIAAEVDAVAVLPGWEHSRASAEVALGLAVGIPILDAHTADLIDAAVVGLPPTRSAPLERAPGLGVPRALGRTA